MKKLLILILGLWSFAYGQTTQQFRYDTTKFLKVGGRNHVMIENLIPLYDSTAKPLAVGADGVIKRVAYWPGSGSGGGAVTAVFRSVGTDSVYAVIGGLPYFQYRDSIGSSGLDSTTVVSLIDANAIVPADTAAMLTPYVRQVIAGAGVTVTGTAQYPVVSSTGGGSQVTSDSTIIATGGQTAFTFSSVPASYSDYIIFVNGAEIEPTTYFTTSGNVVTFTGAMILNDRIRYRRIK